jgi:thioredoxin reductase (NADPH)
MSEDPAGRSLPIAESDVAFPRLDEEQIATMTAAGERIDLAAGQILYSPGDLDNDMVLVLSGVVEIVDAIGCDDEAIFATYRARQFLGELNLITAEPTYLTARVVEAGEGVSISREALNKVVSRDSRLGDLIMSALVTRRALIIESEGGARLIGSGSDPATRQLREFLTRNRVPHGFTDLDRDATAGAAADGQPLDVKDLPMLITGAAVLRAPTILEAANALNLRAANKTAKTSWDCLIVGGGPGGLGAAVYAATEGLSTILVDAVALGGQASTSSRIENYLGFPAGISGSDLAQRAIAQARRFGLRTAVPERALNLRVEEGRYVVELDSGDELAARTVVLATGASYRQLPVDGVEQLSGAGIFYAATLIEARMCGGSSVAVVGGGNSAGQAAIFLSGTTGRVSLLLRGPDLRAGMSSYLVDQIEAIENIDVLLCTEVRELHGDRVLVGLVCEENRSGERREMPVDGLFIFIGADPCTEWLDGSLAKDDDGFLLTGGEVGVTHLQPHTVAAGRPSLPLETSLPGVFAVGDGRSGSIKRVASAVGEGSMAVRLVHEHLSTLV